MRRIRFYLTIFLQDAPIDQHLSEALGALSLVKDRETVQPSSHSATSDPTFQDLWNTAPEWRFPCTAHRISPTQIADFRLDGGFASQVVGTSAYVMWNDTIYAKLSPYDGLSQRTLTTIGAQPNDGLQPVAPCWRFVFQDEVGKSHFSVGTFGLHGSLDPGFDASAGTDKFTDFGRDATWQTTVSKKHVFSVNAAAIVEPQVNDASVALGSIGVKNYTLGTMHADASYYYDQTWYLKDALFQTPGETDAVRFAPTR